MKLKLRPILYIVCFLIVMSGVFAAKVSDVKVFVNNEREYAADETGGDIKVVPKDNVDWIVEIQSDYNYSIDAKLRLTVEDIDAGSNLVKDQDWYSIPPNDYKQKMLSFVVPEKAKIDEYRTILRVYYRINGTENYTDITYYTQIEDTTDKDLDLATAMYNMTTSCSKITESIGTCFSYMDKYTNMSSDFRGCNEQKATFESEKNSCVSELDICKQERASRDAAIADQTNQMKNMKSNTDCEAYAKSEVQKTKSSYENIMMGAVVIGGFGFIMWNRKKNTATIAGSHNQFTKKL